MIIQSEITNWTPSATPEIQSELVDQLESGHVLHFSTLPFLLHENELKFLNPDVIASGRKNISYDFKSNKAKGINPQKNIQDQNQLTVMMHRFAESSRKLVEKLFPSYVKGLEIGRTSFRPIEIATRAPLSGHKDDRLLHVDAFPATPVSGKRILRLFSNIHPGKMPRSWRLGENFSEAMEKFIPKIKKPLPMSRKLKQYFRITRGYQTLYDHYMLNLHNSMKMDADYQQKYPEIYDLPPQSSWLVFTDVAPHAAMAGQYLLEQTFYLPPEAMIHPERSPLAMLEKFLNQPLSY